MKNKKMKPTIEFTPRYYLKDAMHDNPLGGACSICRRKAPKVLTGVKACVCDACVTASIGRVEQAISRAAAAEAEAEAEAK